MDGLAPSGAGMEFAAQHAPGIPQACANGAPTSDGMLWRQVHVSCTSGDNKIDAVPDPDDEDDVWFCHTCYDMQVTGNGLWTSQ